MNEEFLNIGDPETWPREENRGWNPLVLIRVIIEKIQDKLAEILPNNSEML